MFYEKVFYCNVYEMFASNLFNGIISFVTQFMVSLVTCLITSIKSWVLSNQCMGLTKLTLSWDSQKPLWQKM